MKVFPSFLKISRIGLILGLLTYIGGTTVQAQSLRDRFKKRLEKHHSNKENQNNPSNLTNSEIVAGLKQALEIGAQNASKELSRKNGFFKNAAVKILMPPKAKQVASTLRSMGMGDVVDNAILKMNRAAEDAAQQAAPIFVNAVKGMTIQDGVQILTGSNNAATQYLQRATSSQLKAAFSPVIRKSLNKVNAPQVWQTVFRTYNQIPFVEKVNPDLVDYVTNKALEGIFYEVAQEELKIRKDPKAQVTNLLRKVFGG